MEAVGDACLLVPKALLGALASCDRSCTMLLTQELNTESSPPR